jgi:uncharacterized protein (UPF0147 family)
MRTYPSASWFDFLRIESELAVTFIGLAKSYWSPKNSARALGMHARHLNKYGMALRIRSASRRKTLHSLNDVAKRLNRPLKHRRTRLLGE